MGVISEINQQAKHNSIDKEKILHHCWRMMGYCHRVVTPHPHHANFRVRESQCVGGEACIYACNLDTFADRKTIMVSGKSSVSLALSPGLVDYPQRTTNDPEDV
jgi:MinD superfamily P-loop ATPase